MITRGLAARSERQLEKGGLGLGDRDAGAGRGVDGMGPAAGPQRVPFLPPLELPVLVFGAVWSKEGAGGAPWPRCLSWRTRGVLEGAGTPQHPGAGCWGRFGHGATRLGWHAWIVQLAGCLESTKSERIKKKKKKDVLQMKGVIVKIRVVTPTREIYFLSPAAQ